MSDPQAPKPLGLEPSFGFGDRLGLATPGHLDAIRSDGGPIRPVFAQQSIREMTRTRRSPEEVMAAANEALVADQYDLPWGADADHLKTPGDVTATAEAGFVFFTIDPSDHVDGEADSYDVDTVERKFADVAAVAGWVDHYRDRTVQIEDGPKIEFDAITLKRAAVKYGPAIAHARQLAEHIASESDRLGRDHEIELSVDETPQPTTLAEHYIIADQCLRAGMKLVSLAPRYVGQFEKGIDYKGDLAGFERSLAEHAAIARQLGPYKLSLHSGSDKLSIYPAFARITRGMFHVKTAGTSYLEALRVAARHDPALFRSIIGFSRDHFETDRATYHISATLDAAPSPDILTDASELERLYLDEDPGRQILHVTFGSVLTDQALAAALRQVLRDEPATHRQVLATHLGRHLAALREGMGR